MDSDPTSVMSSETDQGSDQLDDEVVWEEPTPPVVF